MVAAQGGDLHAQRAIASRHTIEAQRDGYVHAIDTARIGEAVVELGGGRRVLSDCIDHSVGLRMQVRLGDQVTRGQPLVALFAPAESVDRASRLLQQSITLSDEAPDECPLILERITS